MKQKDIALILATLLSANAQANNVGFYFGSQIWHSKTSGNISKQDTTNALGFDRELQQSLFIAIEHPFPLLPYMRIARTTFNSLGKNSITQQYSADNETSHVDVRTDRDIEADLNLNFIDYTLYYSIYDNNVVAFDLGLTVRRFNGGVDEKETSTIVTTTRDYIWDGEEHDDHDYHNIIDTNTNVSTTTINAKSSEAMLHVATTLKLPVSDLSVYAYGDFSIANDRTIYDYHIGFNYDLIDSRVIDLDMTLGYRAMKLELIDSNNLSAEVDVNGAFVGFISRF
ncbi:TIGR04219 family outer membrane beta-barrel protein [Thalassotalea ganghwensis]